MKKYILLLTLLIIATLTLPAQEKVALVIGNSAYEHVAPLKNPLNDAQDIGATLENLGFSVTRALDASRGEIQQAVDRFQEASSRRGTKVALFYYSGHGVEYEGSNYIIPVNAEIRNEYELVDQAFSADRIVKAMDRNRAAFNLVILDACRDNPFFSSRSGSRGLASMSGGGRSMIVFATSPGQVAADGSGRNSPFTKAFIEHAATPGLEVTAMMKAINGTVQKLTSGRQVPWYTTSYSEDVFLSAAEELTGADGLVGRVNREIAALEAAIAQREKAIASARTEAEKRLLELEQRRARAEESAKRMQAEQLSEIAARAKEALQQKESEDALRSSMEKQLSAQKAALTEQAKARRGELQKLNEKNAAEAGIWGRLEKIVSVNNAIIEIDNRFDTAIAKMEKEVNALYDQQKTAVRVENPKEPFETQEEYEGHIAGLEGSIEGKRKAELNRRRREFNSTRSTELTDFRKQLSELKKDLEGRRFTLDFSATTVEVSPFNAKTKQFPMEVRAADRRFRFVVPVAHTLRASGRDALRKAYYQIYQADQTGGLAGELTYTVREAHPDIWVLEASRARVVNLLENDAEVVRTNKPEGQMLVSTVGDTVKTLAAAVRLESQGGRANVSVNGKPAGTTPVLYTLPDYAGTVKVEYVWGRDKRVFSIDLRSGLNAPAIASPQGLERRWGRADTARLGLAVEGLSPTDRSRTEDNTPTLSWKTSSGAGGYQVQVASSRGGLEKASPVGVASRRGIRGTYTPTKPLKVKQTHYWRVRAVDGNGHFGAWSVIASIYVRDIPEGYVLVEGGTFRRGSPSSEDGRDDDDGPQHSVTVGSFYMKATEVTQKEWREVMGSNPSRFRGDNLPVENVSWFDAMKYCNALSKKEGRTPVYRINGNSVTANWSADGYRLPTEAEWEYAARGGKKSRGYKYSGSNSVGSVGWYNDNSGSKTHPVGQKQANELGLYDMSGNVWEWCWDWYGDYSSGSQRDPRGPSSGSYRVGRGGSWFYNGRSLRSAFRLFSSPGVSGRDRGFRLAFRT